MIHRLHTRLLKTVIFMTVGGITKVKNMKKTFALLITTVFITPCFAADHHYSSRKELNKAIANYLRSQNLPLPDSGIQIVPASSLSGPSERVRRELSDLEQQNRNGFVRKNNMKAKSLLELPHTIEFQLKNDSFLSPPTATYMRKSIYQLKMAYAATKIPASEIGNYLGAAPYGTYHENGWDGSVQYFVSRDIGVCAYTEHNMQLSHGGVRLAKEAVSYEINNKPTLIHVSGDKSSGYAYEIRWYDPIYARTLECAVHEYKSHLKETAVRLASTLDSTS